MLSDLKEKLYTVCSSSLYGRGVKYDTYCGTFLFKNITPK
jgi:hypothetical protein